jgi:hypothetical protein
MAPLEPILAASAYVATAFRLAGSLIGGLVHGVVHGGSWPSLRPDETRDTFAVRLPAPWIVARMPRSDGTFIVRVRGEAGDAGVEQPRLARRRCVTDVVDVGALIADWLDPRTDRPGDEVASISETRERRSA